jgi:hypothetical protein
MTTSIGLPPALAVLFAERHDIVTAAEMRRTGVGRTAADTLLRCGTIHRITRGVYGLAGAADTLEHRCRRLSLLHPGGFVTGPTAAMLGGLRRQPRASALHYTVPHGRRLDAERGVWYHQSTQISPEDRQFRPDGIVMASWPRLAFDLAAHLPATDHRSVVEQMMALGLVTKDELRHVEQRLGHARRPGSGAMARTLGAISSGRAQDSDAEVRLLEALERRGVPVVPQVPVLADGRLIHLDLGVPEVRWGIELDIHPEHRTVPGHGRDARRRRSLRASDWAVEVVTEVDVAGPRRLEATADELAGLYHRHPLRGGAANEG